MKEIRYNYSNSVNSRCLQTCDIPLEYFAIEPFTMVIFGGAGDLSQRELLPAQRKKTDRDRTLRNTIEIDIS